MQLTKHIVRLTLLILEGVDGELLIICTINCVYTYSYFFLQAFVFILKWLKLLIPQ